LYILLLNINFFSIILWKHFSLWVSIFLVWLKIISSWIRNFVDFVFVPKIKCVVYIFSTYQVSLDLQLPVQSVPITTKIVSSNPVHGKVHHKLNQTKLYFFRSLPPNIDHFEWHTRHTTAVHVNLPACMAYTKGDCINTLSNLP
jgi:hypothetical protein